MIFRPFKSTYKGIFFRILLCICMAGVAIYTYIYKQNELTELRMAIPSLAKEVRSIQEENNRLKYEIDQFESPIHLMELLRMPEFSGLKYGYSKDVVIFPNVKPLPGKDFIDLVEEGVP